MLQEHKGFKAFSKLGLDVNKTIWVDSNYIIANIISTKNVFKILTILSLEIPFSKNSFIDTI